MAGFYHDFQTVLAKATKQSIYNFQKYLHIYATFASSKPSDVTYINWGTSIKKGFPE